MRRTQLLALLSIAVILVAGGVEAQTAGTPRLQGRFPDTVPLVSIEQTRGTALDALDAIAKQAGWSLVVADPETVSSPLVIQIRKRPANEAVNLVLEAASLRATFADGVLKVGPETTAASGELGRAPKSRRGGRHERGERVVVGGSLRIEADEVVPKAVAVGGSLTVLGHVFGDAVAVGGSVTLRPGARVDGNAVAIGGIVTVDEGARLAGNNVSIGGRPLAWILGALAPLGALALLGGLAWRLLVFVITLGIVFAFPDRVARVRSFVASRPGVSALGGLALLLGFIPLCVLLAITIIGIPLIPVAMMLLIALLFFGHTVAALWLGERIPLLQEGKTPLKAVALGAVALAVVNFVPWIGTPVTFLAALVPAGATLVSRLGQRAEVMA